MKSSPRGKRSKPHCLQVELVKTVFGAAAAAGVVEVGRRAAAVPGGEADLPGEVAGCTARRSRRSWGGWRRSGAHTGTGHTKEVTESQWGAAHKRGEKAGEAEERSGRSGGQC